MLGKDKDLRGAPGFKKVLQPARCAERYTTEVCSDPNASGDTVAAALLNQLAHPNQPRYITTEVAKSLAGEMGKVAGLTTVVAQRFGR